MAEWTKAKLLSQVAVVVQTLSVHSKYLYVIVCYRHVIGKNNVIRVNR